MAYTTHWELLDKDNELVKAYTRICFSNHVGVPFAEALDEEENDQEEDPDWDDGADIIKNGDSTHTPRYFVYKFHNTTLNDDVIEQYFRFVKATPEFTHLMPRSIKKMVKDKAYVADLTAMNGTQLFTILSILRAVVEEPALVGSVIKFDPKVKYSIPHLGILKAAGSRHSNNIHHWFALSTDSTNLDKSVNQKYIWDDPTPALLTGLVRGIHEVFEHPGDGYMISHPVKLDWAENLLAEHAKKVANKAEKAVKKQKALNKLTIKPYIEDTTMRYAYA